LKTELLTIRLSPLGYWSGLWGLKKSTDGFGLFLFLCPNKVDKLNNFDLLSFLSFIEYNEAPDTVFESSSHLYMASVFS
jgi:hypothetical protein